MPDSTLIAPVSVEEPFRVKLPEPATVRPPLPVRIELMVLVAPSHITASLPPNASVPPEIGVAAARLRPAGLVPSPIVSVLAPSVMVLPLSTLSA